MGLHCVQRKVSNFLLWLFYGFRGNNMDDILFPMKHKKWKKFLYKKVGTKNQVDRSNVVKQA